MYPLAPGNFAPLNAWYVAAWSSEVGRDPIERWILDEPVALYRKQDGVAVALDGRCPHRSYPLGKSRVVGDDIQCGYHGIRFGPDGRGTHIPSQDMVPGVCKVRAYPLAERWQWLWIWPGDPALADESLIPDHFAIGLTDPQNTCMPGCYHHVPGRYMLLHDNLFDLTHIEFLHAASFGEGTKSDTVPTHSEGPGWLGSRHDQSDIATPPFLAHVVDYTGNIDRTFGLTLALPCLHWGSDDLFARQAGGSRGELLGSLKIFHAVTPATKTSCHYFFALGHGWSHLGRDFLEGLAGAVVPGIQEDVFAVTEIEKMIGHAGGNPGEILLKADHVCVRGRRLFEKMIAAERVPSRCVDALIAAE